jgi:hypothetical protein
LKQIEGKETGNVVYSVGISVVAETKKRKKTREKIIFFW